MEDPIKYSYNQRATASLDKALIKSSMLLILSTGSGIILSFIQKILLAGMLGPVDFGKYTIFAIFISYANYADGGVNNASLITRSKLKFSNRLDEAALIGCQANLFIVFTSILLSLGVWLILSFMGDSYLSNTNTILIVLVAVTIPCYSIINIFTVEARLTNNFNLISYVGIVAPLSVVIYLYIISKNEIEDKLIYAIFSFLIMALVTITTYSIELKIKFANRLIIKEVIELIKTGVPLLVFPLGYYTFLSLDRIILVNVLEERLFGNYSFIVIVAYSILSTILAFQAIINQKFLEIDSKETSKNEADDIILKTLMISSFLAATVFGLMLIVMPIIIDTLFTDYKESTSLLKNIFIAYSFLFPVGITWGYLVSVEKKLFGLTALIIVIIILSIMSWCLVEKNDAYGATISIIFAYSLISLLFMMILRHLVKIRVSDIVSCYMPILIFIIISNYEIFSKYRVIYFYVILPSLIILSCIWLYTLIKKFQIKII